MAQPLILFRNPTTGKFVRPLNYAAMRAAEKAGSSIPAPRYDITCIATWGYATGFPKNHDISKAIDKMVGNNGRVVGTKRAGIGRHGRSDEEWVLGSADEAEKQVAVTEPESDDALKWHGWGTALKPSHELIVLARKLLSESGVARNVLEHGTGGLNIGDCVIPTDDLDDPIKERWPANTLRTEPFGDGRDKYFLTPCFDPEVAKLDDALLEANGFFFVPKASRSEREFGCEGLAQNRVEGTEWPPRNYLCTQCGKRKQSQPGSRCECVSPTWEPIEERPQRANDHPTAKPIALFRHIVRLLTPPGGTVLDPFLGSGTTGIACILEGFEWVGIEQDEHYVEIARARVKAWAEKAAEEKQQLSLVAQD